MKNASYNAQNSANELINSMSEKKKDYSKIIGGIVDSTNIRNPFVKSDGTLVNKHIDYQKVLDDPSVSASAKQFISQATGLSPTMGGASSNLYSAGIIGASGNCLVDTAKKYLGTQYVWGGASPEGFDCSGLMQYVFKENGVDIGRTSQEQFKKGIAVDKGNLQPGDLVFFAGYTKDVENPGHVGLYIGDGQYIQAPKTGDVVKISNLSGRSDYAGARRIS